MSNINEARKNGFQCRNPDSDPVGDEQLFAELSQEEAALIVGGGVVEFESIRILESSAKSICLYVGRNQVWSASILDGTQVLPVLPVTAGIDGSPVVFGYNGSTFIELFEDCEEGSEGTRVDRVNIPDAAVFRETTELKRDDDSIYRLTYRIY